MELTNAAELLRRARLRRGISQEALAIRAGQALSDIVGIEDGDLSPAMEDLKVLLHLVGEDLVVSAKERDTGVDRTLNRSNLELSTEQRVRRGLEFADFVRENRGGGPGGLGRSLQPASILTPLRACEVDFVVVGSFAGLTYGSAYPTFDLDIAYSDKPENLHRLVSALEGVGQRSSIADFREKAVQSFNTEFGTLDIVGEVPGIRSYEELRRDACRQPAAGVSVEIASLNHLIAMKRVSRQRKDQLMVMEYVELADEIWRRKQNGAM